MKGEVRSIRGGLDLAMQIRTFPSTMNEVLLAQVNYFVMSLTYLLCRNILYLIPLCKDHICIKQYIAHAFLIFPVLFIVNTCRINNYYIKKLV